VPGRLASPARRTSRSARGVALVCQLLTDGRGPLYREACRDDLAALVEQAVQRLNG